MTYRYRLYGLVLGCEFPLPELDSVRLEEALPADITIHYGTCAREIYPPGADQTHLVYHTASEVALHYDGYGRFLVRDGRELVVDPLASAPLSTVRALILGALMGLLLGRRGYLVLHASAVSIGGRGVALAGVKGAGKSTTVAALNAHGHALISDDVTALQVDGDLPLMLPAVPQVRLWPDTVAWLGHQIDDLPRIHPDYAKRYWRAAHFPLDDKVLLRQVFILERASQLVIEKLAPQAAFFALMRHTYLARWPALSSSAVHFNQVSRLANQIVVYSLGCPRDLDRLPEIAQMVEQHLAES